MNIYSAPDFDQHERVVFCYDPKLDIKAMIAVHSTHLGPALGGCRLWPYETEQEAVLDVLRLSKGMTYKAAISGLNLGGGKMVVIADPRQHKSREFFNRIGEFVDTLNGQYITAEDVGVNVQDIGHIQEKTPHVVGLAEGHGNPSPFTAYGVYRGLISSVMHKFNQNNLSGLKVIVQGLGAVGYTLSKHLHEAGAKLYVHDTYQPAVERIVEEFGATAITAEEVYTMDADVYAPCALGAILNEKTIPQLKVQVVCGAANNQLMAAPHGQLLMQRGILYAPDYVVNQGGVVCVWYEQRKEPVRKIYAHIDKMHETLGEIFSLSEERNISTSDAANSIAEKRFKPDPKMHHDSVTL